MPKVQHMIGDQVYASAGVGECYIASKPFHYSYTDAFGTTRSGDMYLVYVDHNTKPFVTYVLKPRFQKAATEESIELIQTHIFDMFQPRTTISPIKTGSIVGIKRNGLGLVLSGGYQRPTQVISDSPWHHILYLSHDSKTPRQGNIRLDFVGANDLDVLREPTPESYKAAWDILNNMIFEPIFATAPMPNDTRETDPNIQVIKDLFNTKINLNMSTTNHL